MSNEQIDFKPMEAAREYAEKQFPNANDIDAPYCTTGDRFEDVHDAFLAGYKAAAPSKEWVSVEDEAHKKDALKLYEKVLGMSPTYWDNPNGPYTYTCPFCFNDAYRSGGQGSAGMDDIKHDHDCAYLIAKDLATNLLPAPPSTPKA